MTAETFEIDIDNVTSKRFVYQAIDEHDKNHTVDSSEPANQPRMYETTGKHEICLL